MSADESWFDEKQSAWLYRALADVEGADSAQGALFAKLAREAEHQAEVWEPKRTARTPFAPTPRARLVAALARRLGVRASKPALAAMKVRGLSALASGGVHHMPASIHDVGRSHRGVGAGNLRAAVFGINDGLVSNTGLVLGVAGASDDPSTLVLAGVAGLLAGAFSMAAGEWVSVRSQRELLEHQLALERDELATYPAEEAAELALIYQARGLAADEARVVADRLVADPAHALETLAREELGVDPRELGSPWAAAGSSFVAFAIGAAIPLVPVLLTQEHAVPGAAGLSAMALFATGATISLFTGRSALVGGLRMLAIGAAAGALTFGIGRLLGVAAG